MIDVAGVTLVGVNAAAGGIGAVVLSGALEQTDILRLCGLRRGRAFLLLIVLFFVECCALAAGMLTQVFTFGLGIVWGWVIGRRLGTTASPEEIGAVSLRVGLYSCLPSLSLLSIPVVMALSGWSVFTPEAGARFGIPTFLPWPTDTITGFFVGVAGVTLVVKTAVTVAVARTFARRDCSG